jgi:SAM-dependent methyltransferase
MKNDDIIELNKRAWDRLAENYDENRPKTFSAMFKHFTLSLEPGGKVLDLGCGTGLPYARYLVDNGFDVVGLDVSDEMIKIAKRNVPEAEFIQLSMDGIDYVGVFDGVVSSFSMLLLTPKLFRETAQRIHRALRKKGLLYLSLNEPKDEHEDPDAEAFVEVMGQQMYSRGYRAEEIRDIVQPIGFKEIKFNRMINQSDAFGEEHVIEFIFKKKGNISTLWDSNLPTLVRILG